MKIRKTQRSPKYEEHASVPVRRSANRLEKYPGVQAADCVVWKYCKDIDLWEGLNAERIGRDRVRILALPFFAYDLSLESEVPLEPSATDELVVSESGESRWSCVRVLFKEPVATQEILKEISDEGDFWVESRDNQLFAFASPGIAATRRLCAVIDQMGLEYQYETASPIR